MRSELVRLHRLAAILYQHRAPRSTRDASRGEVLGGRQLSAARPPMYGKCGQIYLSHFLTTSVARGTGVGCCCMVAKAQVRALPGRAGDVVRQFS